MSIIEIVLLLTFFWAINIGTFIVSYALIKHNEPSIIETIKEVKSRNEINKVEVVTEEMEADMEEGVMNEYYSRF